MIERVMFIGSKHLGIRSLKTLYSLAPDKLHSVVTINDYKDTRCKLDEFKEFSKHARKRLHVLTKPSELESLVEEDSPEMCIVVGWYWIFKESLLAKVPKGVVGIHASLLPKYRGGSPLVWPIIKGDKESGLSLFYLDKGMDTGDVIAQKRFSIMDDDTMAEVLEKAESLTVELLEQNYPLLLEGTASRIQQNHDEATYFPQRKPEDGWLDCDLPPENQSSNNVRLDNDWRCPLSAFL